MGGGRSTAMFARFVQQKPRERILISIDHDETWLRKTQSLLNEQMLLPFVKLVLAPIGKLRTGPPGSQGYDLEPDRVHDLACGKAIDLLLIDGPPADVGRAETLPSVRHLLAAESDVFLDDADRDGEQRALDEWQRQYAREATFKGVLPLTGGLGWFRFHAPGCQATPAR